MSDIAGGRTGREGENVPPTQYLVMEVLGARWRLGEQTWTFPSACRKALDALQARGWVWHKDGIVERTRLAGLTDEGRGAWLLSATDELLHLLAGVAPDGSAVIDDGSWDTPANGSSAGRSDG